jgi:hypothetical protein
MKTEAADSELNVRHHNSEEHSYISSPLSFTTITTIVESENTLLSKIIDPKKDENNESENLYNVLHDLYCSLW